MHALAEPARALDLRLPSPVEELHDERLAARGIRLLLKRDDLIHPEITGNKYRKLHYNLSAAVALGYDRLLTFGGAYSNHIRATAAAARACGLSSVGVIRGEPHTPLNPSLAFAARQGMRLVYMDRGTYRAKHTREVLDTLRREHGDAYVLPEGGTNPLAVRGCTEIPSELNDLDVDVVCCACGTGGTLAGIAAGLRPGQRALGFSVLKGGQFLTHDVQQLQQRTFGTGNWRIEPGFHFGGFARTTAELQAFIDTFRQHHGLVLEQVYVAKMLYGIFALADRGQLRPGTTVVAVITG